MKFANRLFVNHIITLSGVSLILHSLWEYYQCSLFFVHDGLPPTAFSMISAILGDLVLTWLVQIILALFTRNWFWSFEKWRTKEWFGLMILAIAMSIAIELRALYFHRWTYTSLTPLIPGTSISIIPVFQLLILFPLAFFLAKRLTQKWSPK